MKDKDSGTSTMKEGLEAEIDDIFKKLQSLNIKYLQYKVLQRKDGESEWYFEWIDTSGYRTQIKEDSIP